MEIIEIKLSDLKPSEYNPRQISEDELNKLSKSIQKFGFVEPVVINKDLTIIGGHQRIKAAELLGLTTVPCYKVDLPEKEAKVLNLALNNISGEWDDTKLRELLEELNGDGLLELTGFVKEELDELIELFEESQDTLKEDILDNVPSRCKVGELWKLGKHRLLCGDATSKSDVERCYGDSKMVLMITDPPYGVNYTPEWREGYCKTHGIGKPVRSLGKVDNDDRVDWTPAFELFNGDVGYIWHASWFTKEAQESIEKCGCKKIAEIIWVKPHFTFGRGDYHWKHEPCMYFVKKGKKHNWQGSRTETTVWEIAGMNCFGSSQDDSDKTTGHSTQKPLECMRRPILNNSTKGENIYDPFGGSGTTLIACEQSNRNCFMLEINPEYCDVIIQRWENLTGETAKKIE